MADRCPDIFRTRTDFDARATPAITPQTCMARVQSPPSFPDMFNVQGRSGVLLGNLSTPDVVWRVFNCAIRAAWMDFDSRDYQTTLRVVVFTLRDTMTPSTR
eukprot:11163221-Lingulodinium_polyedra.AAC.1